MTGDTHYDLEILAELAEGLLDAGTARQVREHLAVCDPCGELLADLAAVREVLAATPTPAMPMGVALRIDKALAAEAGRGGGVGLVEAPDWQRFSEDSPWERQPVEEEPVRLGVVGDDGVIRERTPRRRRRWAMPAVAVAAAAAVVGTAVISTSMLTASGGSSGNAGYQAGPASSPPKTHSRARTYALTNSDYNYSDSSLKQPLEGFLAPAQALGGQTETSKIDKCVAGIADRTKLKTFAVDQGMYNGQEALIIASWKDRAAKRLRVDVVDPYSCKPLRKASLGRW